MTDEREDCIKVGLKELIDEKAKDLKDNFEIRLRAIEDKIKYQADTSQVALNKAFESTQLAISKVEIATANRFESVNEFRGTLKDQVATFATRNELDGIKNALNEKMSQSEYDSRHESLEKEFKNTSSRFENYYSKNEINELIKNLSEETRKVSDRQWILALGIITALLGIALDYLLRK